MVQSGDFFNIKRVSSLGVCIKELPRILYHGYQSTAGTVWYSGQI
jgi:hypothetical protein